MAKRIPTREPRDPYRFFSRLSYAFCELVLIVLLFSHALLSYLVHKFAHYCKLPIPCLLCLSLDRSIPYFYKELICNVHELEVSSLAYCHTHHRLVDAHEMCDGCLLSFLGKVGSDLDDGLNANFLCKKFYGEDMIKAPLLKKDIDPNSPSKRCCSCCLVPFRNRPLAHSLLQSKHITKHDVPPLPKGSENRSRPLASNHAADLHLERPSHVGYSKAKISSDTESEVPFLEEDDRRSLTLGIDDVKEELLSRCLQAAPTASVPKNVAQVSTDDIFQEKLIHPSPIMNDGSNLGPERSLGVSDSHSTIGMGHGLEEIIWNQVDVKPDILMSSEIAVEQVPIEALITKLDVPDNHGYASNGDVNSALSSADILGLRSSQILNERLTSSIKVPLPSPASSEFNLARESSRVPEDLKVRLSQMSTNRWQELSWNDISSSPRTAAQADDISKISDASGYSGFPLAKRFSTDRYESGVESLDGSLVSEMEGQSAVDRLKRQIEMDRKSMSILYKELEEERNASAIAANQAMAMITRLQEEKASMQMEALQYLRMMEEQTEYDQEALQKLNDLLADRDKEIQDLEALVESYRKQFGGEPLASRVLESSFDCEEREYTEYTPVSTPRFMRSRGRENGKTLMRNTILDFEDEKIHISECLRRLERKLKLFSNSVSNKDSILEGSITENGECDDEQEHPQMGNVTEENSQKTEKILLERERSPSTPSFHAIPFSIKEALRESKLRSISCNERQFHMGGKKSDIIAFGNEIAKLNARLEALEEDRNFLEHAVSSLRNGSNGIQFIQEIACHLRELRKIGITHQEKSIA